MDLSSLSFMRSLATITYASKALLQNPECDWQSTPTISIFGTDIHPDLAKLQCEQERCIVTEKLQAIWKS